MRKAFAESMIELAEKDDKLVLLIGDISHYLLKDFEDRFPNRFFNAGICEQSIVGVAAGLAMEGYRPVVHTIAPFCVERAYEQIKVDLCYQELDVTIISVGSSFDYAHLGCTHHCYEDISILRPLPNIDLFVPGTSSEYKRLINDSWNNGRSKYFKLTKTEHNNIIDVSAYRNNILNVGNGDVAVFVNGHLLGEVTKLKDYKKHTVVYCPTVEPIEEASQKQIASILRDSKVSVVVEENSSAGAFADKIFDIASHNNVRTLIKKIGIPRKFCTNYGTADEHRQHLGLTSQQIENTIKEALRNV
tara:strand:+ start:92 stop:1000 length:909 start_codon:yes stop_codon:yes gene_type:complete